MKTNLTELLSGIGPMPLESHGCTVTTKSGFENGNPTGGDTFAVTFDEHDDSDAIPTDQQIDNARLIAHAVNVLPALVSALQTCIHAVDLALCGTPSAQYFNELKQRLGSEGYTLEDNLKLNMADIKGACSKAHKAARAALAAAENVEGK